MIKKKNSDVDSDGDDDSEYIVKPDKDNAFARGLEPVKILGASDTTGELTFLIQFKGMDQGELIPAKVANLKCPQLVIKFYEERLTWYSDDENDD